MLYLLLVYAAVMGDNVRRVPVDDISEAVVLFSRAGYFRHICLDADQITIA
jgi:hypothetical protein